MHLHTAQSSARHAEFHTGQLGNDRTRRIPLPSSSLIESSSHPVLDLHLDDPNSPESVKANQFPFHCRMIAIFDEDGGGDVDFQEFVSGLSAFSSKGNKEEKLKFAFKVYDIDRDGYISNGELFIVLKMMVGSNLKDMQLQQVCFPAPCQLQKKQKTLPIGAGGEVTVEDIHACDGWLTIAVS